MAPVTAAVALSAPSVEGGPAATVVCDRVIDDFSSSKVGQFPSGWRTREADEMPFARSKALYVVEKDGPRHVLHARYRGEAITIGRKVDNWELERYPFLSWEWRVVQLPTGGDERRSSRNDSAAAVYGIWDVGFPFYVDGIKYAWSSVVPKNEFFSKRLGHDHVYIVESGKTHVGKWRKMRVNLLDHYREFFDRKEPRSPDGIAILTDADATESNAEAYYADFRLCRMQPAP